MSLAEISRSATHCQSQGRVPGAANVFPLGSDCDTPDIFD